MVKNFKKLPTKINYLYIMKILMLLLFLLPLTASHTHTNQISSVIPIRGLTIKAKHSIQKSILHVNILILFIYLFYQQKGFRPGKKVHIT